MPTSHRRSLPVEQPFAHGVFNVRKGSGTAFQATPDCRQVCVPQRTHAARPVTGGCRPTAVNRGRGSTASSGQMAGLVRVLARSPIPRVWLTLKSPASGAAPDAPGTIRIVPAPARRRQSADPALANADALPVCRNRSCQLLRPCGSRRHRPHSTRHRYPQRAAHAPLCRTTGVRGSVRRVGVGLPPWEQAPSPSVCPASQNAPRSRTTLQREATPCCQCRRAETVHLAFICLQAQLSPACAVSLRKGWQSDRSRQASDGAQDDLPQSNRSPHL